MNAKLKSGLAWGALACGAIAYAVYQNSFHIFDKPIAADKMNRVAPSGQEAVTVTGATFKPALQFNVNGTDVRFAVIENGNGATSQSSIYVDPKQASDHLIVLSAQQPDLPANVGIKVFDCDKSKVLVFGSREGLADALQAVGADAENAIKTQQWAKKSIVRRGDGNWDQHEEKIYIDSSILGSQRNDSQDHPTTLQGMLNKARKNVLGNNSKAMPFMLPTRKMVVQTVWFACVNPGSTSGGQVPPNANITTVIADNGLINTR
jgi:hypothetical protein